MTSTLGAEKNQAGPVSSAPVVETRALSKIFWVGEEEVVALDRIDLTVGKGEFVSFVGPSGCGKSTLLNLVAGLLPASAGEVLLLGDPVVEPSRRVGFMFQSPVLLPWRTVESNVLLPAEVFGADLGEKRRRARAVIEAVGLGEFANAYVLARMKVATRGRWLWSRTIGSTVIGQGLDSAVFMTVAFAGVIPAEALLGAVVTQWLVKTAYEVLATPLTYAAVGFLKRREGVDVYDTETRFNPLSLME